MMMTHFEMKEVRRARAHDTIDPRRRLIVVRGTGKEAREEARRIAERTAQAWHLPQPYGVYYSLTFIAEKPSNGAF